MAATQVAEVIAAPFTVYAATPGTAFPAIGSAEWVTVEANPEAAPTGWTLVGKSGTRNYSEAGVTVTHTQVHSQFISAGGITPRKKWRTEEAMTIQFDLVDLTPKTYGLIMDSIAPKVVKPGGGEPEYESVSLYRGINIHFYTLLMRGKSTINEEHAAQYQIFGACMNGNPAPKFSLKQGPAMLTLQFDVLEIEAGKWAEFLAQK